MDISTGNITPDFQKGAISQGYPIADHAIYEIEIKDENTLDFRPIGEASKDKAFIKILLDNFQTLESNVSRKKLSSDTMNIEICLINKSVLKPTLIASHYFSLVDGCEEKTNKNRKH